MGSSDSKLSAQAQAQQDEQYATLMKNPTVVAAMEALEMDKSTTGFKFYRLFARMDKDGSKTIDLEEFHQFFELPHTPYSDLVFSNLGKQLPARGVAFDDFVLNLWNFCTMASQDIYTHVFHLYDDDHNGTLDAAECESLFRLLYHTENLPTIVKNQLKSMTSNAAGVITLDAFLTMCTSKKSLFKPIFDLQARTRARSLGESYWASVSKKRVKILNSQKDVFEAVSVRLEANQRQSAVSTIKAASPNSPARQSSSVALSVKDTSSSVPKDGKTTCTTDDAVATKPQEDIKSLGSWVQTESQKEPLVQAYLIAFSQAYVDERLLKEHTQDPSAAPGQDRRLLDLRYSVAVSTKRRDEARTALEELWEHEQSSLITARHEVVSTLVRGISTKTLHKQTGKKSSEKVVRSYTQKKLDIEENAIRGRFKVRWQTLEHAAEFQAQKDLETSRKLTKSGTASAPMILKQKSTAIVSEPSKNRVLPTSRVL